MQLDDAFLSRMAAILEAEYRAGDFGAELARLHEGAPSPGRQWFLRGRHGTFRVRLERNESHLHCLLKATAPQVDAGKALMLQQPATRQAYRLPLAVDEDFLADMAGLLGGSYVAGDLDRSLDALQEGDDDERPWRLEGEQGEFRVVLQRGESYFVWTLLAREPAFTAGKQLMKGRYLASGGDPGGLKPE